MTEDAVHRITEVLQKEMRNVTVNAEDWPTVGALRTAAEIYQPDHHHLPLELEMEVSDRSRPGASSLLRLHTCCLACMCSWLVAHLRGWCVRMEQITQRFANKYVEISKKEPKASAPLSC